MSPGMLSNAKSSLSVPTRARSGCSTHVVVELIRDRAAVGDRREPRAAPRAQHAVHARRSAGRRRAGRGACVKPSASICTTARSSRASDRDTAARGASARSSVLDPPLAHADFGDDLLREHVERRAAATWMRSSSPRPHARRAARRTRPGRRATAGTAGPSGCAPSAWPARPTRCRKAAIARGEPSWQTRSTSPMSMPSSSDAVATSALSSPRLEPLLGLQAMLLREAAVVRRRRAPRRAARARWRATRSAMRRVLTNTSVVRCCATSSASRSYISSQTSFGITASSGERGISSARSRSRTWPASMIVHGRARVRR